MQQGDFWLYASKNSSRREMSENELKLQNVYDMIGRKSSINRVHPDLLTTRPDELYIMDVCHTADEKT